MEVIETQNIKVPNSVLVKPITGAVLDNEVLEYLAQIGSVERVVKVTSHDVLFKDSAIVEFKSGEPIEFLLDTLPCDRPSSDPNVFHHIELLSKWYTTGRGSSLTSYYLTELQSMAKRGGVSFEDVLLEELARIQKSTTNPGVISDSAAVQEPQPSNNVALLGQDINESLLSRGDDISNNLPFNNMPLSTTSAGASASPRKRTVHLTSEQLVTPEVQRVVVEHVINNPDSPSHGHVKLRPFSGKIPCPYPESDYDTWRSNVAFYLADPNVSNQQKVRKIIESLAPPAANIVRHLGPNSTPHEYICLLDSAFETVDDGDELFAKFLNTNQNPGEKPSEYLQRLQIALNKVVKRGGMVASDSDRQLLKQFCRGCWDNSIITSLQLEQRKNKPPSFPDLLLMLRVEEDKHVTKSNRMKQHFGTFKSKVQTNSLKVDEAAQCNQWHNDETKPSTLTEKPPTPKADTQKLEKQLAKLQVQMASLKASLSGATNKSSTKPSKKTKHLVDPNPGYLPGSKPLKKPRPGYCFRCGEDGHIAPSCSNDPNPQLVGTKQREFKQKQQAYEEQSKLSLN
uniref:CCHC-type domain-containing protein n=2 Tax=Nothobranchius furzeri TaxID=105023 RepID=A0A1A7ZSX6_NOTFU